MLCVALCILMYTCHGRINIIISVIIILLCNTYYVIHFSINSKDSWKGVKNIDFVLIKVN